MRTFAQKPNQPKERGSSGFARARTATPEPIHHTHPILHSERTIGNQAVQRLLRANANKLEVDPTSTAATNGFAHDSSQVSTYDKSPLKIQPKLTLNATGNVYEQEADKVAEQMILMPEPRQQIACSCGGGCPKCQDGYGDRGQLQTKTARAHSSETTEAPPIIHEVLNSPGQPLDSATRSFMESRFGHDFSRVRVHTDAKAAQSAQAVRALAYTVGRNIIMNTDQFQPQSKAGQQLLAHELTHVIQQNGVATGHGTDNLSPSYHRPQAGQQSLAVARSTINYRFRLSAVPTAIYRQQPLVEPPIVSQFREVGQLVPPAQPSMTAPINQPVNVPPPTARPEPTPAPTPRPSPPSGPSPQLVYFLMRHEGFYAHPDDVSDPYNCTVGYGNLLHRGTCVGNQSEEHPQFAAVERRFARGITPAQGLSTLVRRLMRDANRLLQRLTVPLSQNQFDALLSFSINSGGGLKSVIAHVNSGEYAAVPGIMLRYTGAATTEGRMEHPRGLARRRVEEAAIWERGDYGHGTAHRHHGCRRMIEDCSNPEHPRPSVVAPPDQR